MTIQLRRHQIEAADAIEAAWCTGVKRPLADMCVAAGKSLTYAELARREVARGGRSLILAHVRELVEQNANACRALGLPVGINAAALGERTWRAPVISAAVQSVYKHAESFGPITQILIDEAHLIPHAESGMYRALVRALPHARIAGGSGTVFRLQGGSLVEGEGAPFDAVVYRYSILDGIRDGYLCPAFSFGADDKIDPTKLRTRQGEFTGDSQDAQMIALMDNHIAQMVHHGADRRAWLIFEASTKAARAMAVRLGEWGIAAGLVLGETPAGERIATVDAYRAGRLRALVNVLALTTGFDVPHVDLLVMRRRTKSLGLYIQMAGRGLRTIGGNIEASIRAGKSDCGVLDFAGNIDQHGPLDFIRVRESKSRLVSCEDCGKRNAAAAAKCWSCGSVMLKNCPACLEAIARHLVDCPLCGHDMRAGPRVEPGAGLLEVPTGAALLRAYAKNADRAGGWEAISKSYMTDGGDVHVLTKDRRGQLPEALKRHGPLAKWVRFDGEAIAAVLVPNGHSRSSALQIGSDGVAMVVPLPSALEIGEVAA